MSRDAPGERCADYPVAAGLVTARVRIEPCLHGVEQGGVDDCGMEPLVGLVPVHDQAEIGAVAQQVEQGTAAEGPASDDPAAAGRSALRTNPAFVEPAPQRMHRTQLEIGIEYRAHGRGFGLVDDERARSACRSVVAEGQVPAHPHALGLGGGNLVADPLAGDLALELGERQQHVQRQPAHARRRVERLGDADEADPVPVEQLDHAGKIGERTGQPVDLVDHDNSDLAGGDIGEQAFERRAFHRTAREPAVVIARRDRAPAFALLTLDVRFAGFPRWASRLLNSWSSPSSELLRV